MWEKFFKHIDIKPENTHILDGNAADLRAECEAFEEKIKAAGGIELFVGGQEVSTTNAFSNLSSTPLCSEVLSPVFGEV